MSENKWSRLGNQIRGAVEDSLSTGNFTQLGDAMSDAVNTVLSEAKKQIGQAMENNTAGNAAGGVYQSRTGGQDSQPRTAQSAQGGRTGAGARPGQPGQSGWGSWNSGMGARPGQGNFQAQTPPRPASSKIKMNKVGSVSSVLYMVFGGIATGIFGFLFLGVFFADMVGATGFAASQAMGLCLAASILMILHGRRQQKRLKRARRYVELCGNSHYINIEDLAVHMGKSEKAVLKDVKKMLKKGFFPQGHLDMEETCLMLDDATWQQYLAIRKERKARELEEKVARMQAKNAAAGSKQPYQEAKSVQEDVPADEPFRKKGGETESVNPELAAMIKEGHEYIRKLRDMNDNIEGEVISAKLFQLENLLKEIFDRVREHPEQMPQMQKFMNYYLPTTLKLVEAYEEFDKVSAPGADIIEAKGEIEKTLDTINQAFVELLNKLFRESVFDVTTDAQVLKTMLAKEGLAKDPILEKLSE